MADTIPPKPAHQRRRRNKPPVPDQAIPADARRKDYPELPGEEWSDWTLDCWDLIWTSPMAINYTVADFPGLVRLMQLQERVADGRASVTAMAEMRQLEDRFGLSPLSRRRLAMEITPTDAETATGDPKDEDRWLRVVGGDE